MSDANNPYAAPRTCEPASAAKDSPALDDRMPFGVVCSLVSLFVFAAVRLGLIAYLLRFSTVSFPQVWIFVVPAVVAIVLFVGVAYRNRFARWAAMVTGVCSGVLLTALAVPVLVQFVSRIQQGDITTTGFAGEAIFRVLEWLLVFSSFTAAGSLLFRSSKLWFGFRSEGQ